MSALARAVGGWAADTAARKAVAGSTDDPTRASPGRAATGRTASASCYSSALSAPGWMTSSFAAGPASSDMSLLGLVRHLTGRGGRGWFLRSIASQTAEQVPALYYSDEDPEGDCG